MRARLSIAPPGDTDAGRCSRRDPPRRLREARTSTELLFTVCLLSKQPPQNFLRRANAILGYEVEHHPQVR